VFIGLYYAFSGLGKVNYNGLVFVKQRFGSLTVYTYHYNTLSESGEVVQNELYLRTNPAENSVPIEGKITYTIGETVFLGINSTGLNECEYGSIAAATMVSFLFANNIAVKSGTPDREAAEQKNQTHITCGKHPTNMVIIIQESNETKITQPGLYCYNIEVANCEILPAVEKFIVQSILDSKEES
jgi:hypothetical protein